MKKFLGDLSLKYKIMGISIPIMVLLAIFAYTLLIPEIESTLIEKKKESTKQTVNVAVNLVKEYVKKSKSGEMSESDAQEQAIAVIKDLRYNEKDYFWINDYYPRMIMHPFKPALNGKDISNFADPNGVKLFSEMAKVCKADGSGFVAYQWPKPGFDDPVDKISYVEAIPEWNWIVGSGIYLDDVNLALGNLKNKLLTQFALLLALILIFGYFISRVITKPINVLKEAYEKVSAGDTKTVIEVTSGDEVGVISAAFNDMVSKFDSLLIEAEANKKDAEIAAAEATRAKRAAEDDNEYLESYANKLVDAMTQFADGELSVYVEPPEKIDVINKLVISFNNVVMNIKEMISRIYSATESAATASRQISASSEELAAGSQEQSAQAGEVASAVEQMAATIMQTSKNVTQAADFAKDTERIAQAGGEVVLKTVEGMERISDVVQRSSQTVQKLGKSSDKIGEIIGVIEEIADQTNLLALNAAIEAARAGEHGRGFAVVADEVRKLAERTTTATKEIGEMINQIQTDTEGAVISISEGNTEVEKGKEFAGKAGDALNEIIAASLKVVDEVNQVATASEEQASAAEQISRNIENISNVSNQSADGVNQIAGAAENLNRMTESLLEAVNKFKLSNALQQSY